MKGMWRLFWLPRASPASCHLLVTTASFSREGLRKRCLSEIWSSWVSRPFRNSPAVTWLGLTSHRHTLHTLPKWRSPLLLPSLRRRRRPARTTTGTLMLTSVRPLSPSIDPVRDVSHTNDKTLTKLISFTRNRLKQASTRYVFGRTRLSADINFGASPPRFPMDLLTYHSYISLLQEMLKDSVRTQSYRKAIVNNPHLFKGKVRSLDFNNIPSGSFPLSR